MARKQCRVWWPRQLLHCKPRFNLLLFGWSMHSFNSIDMVLAFAISTVEISVNLLQKDLQEILSNVDAKMPVTLQKFSTFSVLGICILESNNQSVENLRDHHIGSCSKSRWKMHCLEMDDNASSSSILNSHIGNYSDQKSFVIEPLAEDSGIYSCGCMKLEASIDTQRQSLIKCGNWIQLFSRIQGRSLKGVEWIPEFDHIHQKDNMLPVTDFHLIMYDLPAFGRHHYNLSYWTDHINLKAPIPDLEAVVSALNCSDAAKQLLQQRFFVEDPISCLSLFWLGSKLWYILAILLATTSAVIYIAFQLFYMVLSFSLCKLLTMILKKAFRHTWKNVHIRICQFLYWPIFLLGSGFSSYLNAEFAHIDALRKHHMWSSVAVDLLLGAVYGLTILANADKICFWINLVTRNITDSLLRSGCVWLMGAPAGFKLNTELAEVFGMISLDAIQTFSTMWFFIGSFLQHFIRGLALSGIFFGLTVPAALFIDILKLVTFHIATLHWLISLVYSQQIQALVSLWRLFRGKKWNPLRRRLDSFDGYSVGQHVVGSLLFTPLLLLLPTTSVFYIFFTLLSTSLILICVMIEITISVLHATPYAEILLWLIRRRRFPSGIWIEIIFGTISHSSPGYGSQTADHMSSNLDVRSSNGLQENIVSILHSNYATLGQIVLPCYVRVFGRVCPSFSMQLASGILGGRRIPSCLDADLPQTMPWMQLSFRQYWRLCYCAIVRCNLQHW